MTWKKKETRDRNEKIVGYRNLQKNIAVYRDSNYCTFCYFLYGRHRNAQDVHHVYGRARGNKGLWREHYKNLLCTCRECHPMPLQFKGDRSKDSLRYVEIILGIANENPINKDFDHGRFLKYEIQEAN